jgi:hypothetical protein
MSTLRDEIRRYEARTGTRVRCFGVMRCLTCPLSAIGCPFAGLWMKDRERRISGR